MATNELDSAITEFKVALKADILSQLCRQVAAKCWRLLCKAADSMQEVPLTERRRVPRCPIADTALSVLAFPVPVRLLDISLGGVLLEAAHRVDSGTRGTLRFNFGGTPFSAEVRVERVDVRREGPVERFNIGAAFVSLSREDQRVIERFADQ